MYALSFGSNYTASCYCTRRAPSHLLSKISSFRGLLLQRFRTLCLDSLCMVIVKILELSICPRRKNILRVSLVFSFFSSGTAVLGCEVKTFGSNFQFGLSLDDLLLSLTSINPLAPSNKTLGRQWLNSLGRLRPPGLKESFQVQFEIHASTQELLPTHIFIPPSTLMYTSPQWN